MFGGSLVRWLVVACVRREHSKLAGEGKKIEKSGKRAAAAF